MFTPNLPQEQRDWMLRNVTAYDDGSALALACARHFGLVDEDGGVIGDPVDGELLELHMWAHAETGESHPVCQYADRLLDIVVDDPDKLWAVVAASVKVASAGPVGDALLALKTALRELDAAVEVDM